MQVRRTVLIATAAVLAAGAFAPATAAPAKKFTGTYKLTLQPDPTIQVLTEAGMANCTSLRPESSDKRTIAMPRAGKLKVILDAPDPAGRGLGFDWDMYLLDSKGAELGKGVSAGPKEEVNIVLKTKMPVTIAVCNLTGMTDATVTYALK